MSIKNRILTIILVTTTTAAVSAHETVRTAGIMASEWDSQGSSRSRAEDNHRFWGLETETITSDMTGFGMDALVDFYKDDLNNSMLDWRGQLFMRYHLFGTQSFLDPFIEAGVGNAGSVRLADGEKPEMSLYPFLSAGGNIMLHGGFFAGMRWSYKLDEWIIGTVIPQKELDRHQISFTVGYSYYGYNHRGHDGHYHYHFE